MECHRTATRVWDHGQHEIFGVDPSTFVPTAANMKPLIHPDDLSDLLDAYVQFTPGLKYLSD